LDGACISRGERESREKEKYRARVRRASRPEHLKVRCVSGNNAAQRKIELLRIRISE
jgi:hypothetical protein